MISTSEGWELLPSTFPARLVAVVWWFFCLIICSTYTANLAAYLSKMQLLPDSVDHLLAQNKIRYGCIESTTNCDFFRYATNPLHRHAWFTMTELWRNETIFPDTKEALKYVRSHADFALFDDVSYFRYQMNVDCDLAIVSDALANVSLSFVVNKEIPKLAEDLSEWIESHKVLFFLLFERTLA